MSGWREIEPLATTHTQRKRASSKSFDDEEQQQDQPGEKKPKTFFGFEFGDGVVYTTIIIMTLMFVRRAPVYALN